MTTSSSAYVLFRDDLAGRELLFSRPVDILIAQSPDAFPAVLEAAEWARRAGKWLAGYFSYECGHLFEPKLRSRLPQERRAPLVCLGVFDDPLVRGSTAAWSSGGIQPVFGSRPPWSFADYERRSTGFMNISGRATAIRGTSPSQSTRAGPAIHALHSMPSPRGSPSDTEPSSHLAIRSCSPALRNCFARSTKTASSRPCR